MHSVYILYRVRRDRYTIGSSSDPVRRLQELNQGKIRFMRSERPWTVVYQQSFQEKQEA
ncbi:MAG: GIY-YIG nuclease family protein [Candidatus Neomarinimicrobiota bacterium]|nr:MAG: GIY-YIG nuclease family protein [Candidatus Neomarinimicrobiota bacterium]